MIPSNRRSFGVLVAAVSAGLFGLANEARAGVIYDTFGPGMTYSSESSQISFPEFYTPDPSYGVLGQGFFTPGYATTLDRVVVPFLMDNPSEHITSVSMAIYTAPYQDYGDFGEYYPLQDQVADLSLRLDLQSGAPGEPTVFEYTSPVSVVLQPNTFYYLTAMVVSDPDPEANNFWFMSPFDSEIYQTGFTGLSPLFFDEDKWGAYTMHAGSAQGLAMRIEASPVPEPSSCVAFFLGGCVVVTFFRRKLSLGARHDEPRDATDSA